MGAREALRSSRRSTVRSSSLLKMIPTSRMRRAESVRILMDMIEGRGGNRQVMLETQLRPGGSVRAV